MNNTTKRPARQPILILSHADGHLEIFGDKNVDVHIARVPVASSRETERQAEEVVELLLPRLYRDLYRADLLRGVGTTRPLKPSVMSRVRQAKKDIEILKKLVAA